MKKFLLFLLLLTTLSPQAKSQFVWQAIPNGFRAGPEVLYVDPADSSMWLGVDGSNFSGTSVDAGLARYDKNGQLLNFPAYPYGNTRSILRWNGDLYVGGGNGLARFDGTQWHKIDSNRNFAAFKILPYQGKLILAGSTVWAYTPGVDTLTEFHEFYKTIGSALIYDLAEYKGKLYVAGNFDPQPPLDPKMKEIVCWDGTQWTALQNGISSNSGREGLNCLEVYNDTLYIGGGFLQADGAPGNNIVRWDGTNWHKLTGGGDVPQGYVNDLQRYNGGLVVTGVFDDINGHSCSGVAYYKNGQWCYNQVGPALTRKGMGFGDYFWVSTSYMVGPDTMNYLARISGMGSCLPSGVAQMSEGDATTEVYPNPASGNFTLRRNRNAVAAGGSIWYRITDISGRVLWQAQSRDAELVVSGSESWAPGLYLLTVQTEANAPEIIRLLRK